MRLIDADALMDDIKRDSKEAIDEGDKVGSFWLGYAAGLVIKLPTIQPEPQEGHWIDKGWDGDWAWQIDGRGNCWRVIECSECGKGVSVESNYCPHCGARMKGAEHEID